MGVFDYYNDPNVKSRHQLAFGNIKDTMDLFELAYQSSTGISIRGQMQSLWVDYMRAHIHRVEQFSRTWVGQRLSQLSIIWADEARRAVAAKDKKGWKYAVVLVLIAEYFAGINSQTTLSFDDSIFY